MRFALFLHSLVLALVTIQVHSVRDYLGEGWIPPANLDSRLLRKLLSERLEYLRDQVDLYGRIRTSMSLPVNFSSPASPIHGLNSIGLPLHSKNPETLQMEVDDIITWLQEEIRYVEI